MSALEIAQVLIVSASHLPGDHFLESLSMMKGQDGWLVYVREAPTPEESRGDGEGYAAVMREARKQGVRYVMFDRDAEVLEGAPFFSES